MNVNVFRNISYGLYVISTMDRDRPTGCTANSAMQITSDPAAIAISINHDNYTNKCIEKTGKFVINILAETSEPTIIGTFGFQSGKDNNKFDDISYSTISGLPVLKDTCGYIICEVIDTMETETHTVFLGKVADGDIIKKDPPMTYAYYHNVIKGKSPKNAPTHIPEKDADKDNGKKWVCGVCGYIYDGDEPFEELGDDFVCPVCKQPKKVFSQKFA